MKLWAKHFSIHQILVPRQFFNFLSNRCVEQRLSFSFKSSSGSYTLYPWLTAVDEGTGKQGSVMLTPCDMCTGRSKDKQESGFSPISAWAPGASTDHHQVCAASTFISWATIADLGCGILCLFSPFSLILLNPLCYLISGQRKASVINLAPGGKMASWFAKGS